MHPLVTVADTDTIMFGKLVLAMLLGAAIGTERSVLAREPAGTRTFGLVALGACLFIVVGKYVDAGFVGLQSFDPMHIAAGIVTGVGFIGGGIIFLKNDSVRGATTAAGLWIAAAVGMAVGFGLYAVSIFAAILALIMFTGMWYIEDRFKHWFAQRVPNAGNGIEP